MALRPGPYFCPLTPGIFGCPSMLTCCFFSVDMLLMKSPTASGLRTSRSAERSSSSGSECPGVWLPLSLAVSVRAEQKHTLPGFLTWVLRQDLGVFLQTLPLPPLPFPSSLFRSVGLCISLNIFRCASAACYKVAWVFTSVRSRE